MSEITEKDLKKDILNMMKKSKGLSDAENYEIKHNILNLMGFDSGEKNGIPEITDKKFISRYMPAIVEELLSGSHIDLNVLEKIVKVQNGIFDIELSKTMKDLLNEGILNNRPEIATLKNIQRIKYHSENMDLEDDFFENLNIQSKVLSGKEISREENFEFASQIPINNESDAGVKAKKLKSVEKNNPILEENWQEEARVKFYEKAEAMNAIERKYYKDNKSLDKRSNTKWLDDFYARYYDLKRNIQNPFESTGLVQMASDSNTPLRQVFKYPLIGKGVRFDKFPDDKEAAQIYELAALKVRSDGIEYPYVYTKRAKNELELRQKESFIRGQIKALVAVGYEIENISVDPEMNAVYEGIKQNILKID